MLLYKIGITVQLLVLKDAVTFGECLSVLFLNCDNSSETAMLDIRLFVSYGSTMEYRV